MQQPTSFFWYDFETWGVDPHKDRPCQFAGVRTDLDFNPIGKPVNVFCQIADDYLPHPEACLITGITPQQTLRDGYIEAEFMAKIHAEFSQPGTCVLGYNSIRFDDEVTRSSLFRNFYDPYQREWQHGNSRWDLIDVIRACYALRPEGIEWPVKEDGSPSFKLEALTRANGIDHIDAHDAMSDVYATIAMAKAVKKAQPKLFHYLFSIHKKQALKTKIDWQRQVPLVHVSSKLPALQGCCTWIVPMCPHPTNNNAVVCLNLNLPVAPLLELTPQQMLEKLYQRSSHLGAGETRLPIKLVHLNKCPIVAPAKTLSETRADELGIDRQLCRANLDLVHQHPELVGKLIEMFELESQREATDPDFSLYSGGFLSQGDQQKCHWVRDMPPADLQGKDFGFDDPRLDTLLFRYRARNYPATLNDDEMARWQNFRRERLTDNAQGAGLTYDQFGQQLELLATEHQNDAHKVAILKALYDYAQSI